VRYSLTESGGLGTLTAFDAPESETLGTVGRPRPGTQIEIRDPESDRVLGPDEVGRVCIQSPAVMAGYWRDPEATAAALDSDGWLRTGDLGVLHEGGWIQLKDRLKDGIKSGGEWISTVELENALLEHDAVAEAAVIGVPDPKWEERPFVCIKLAPGATATAPELLAFLDGKVARWWLPERWAFVNTLPKTSVGKLDKKDLRRSYDADGLVVNDLRTVRTSDSALPPSQ
jgi:fatty-acyl-CoA synthase